VSARRFLIKRAVWFVLGVLAVVTLTFLFVALTPDPNRAAVLWGGGEKALSAYAAAKNQNLPLLDRYVIWLERLATLDLGSAAQTVGPSHGPSVLDEIGDALGTTALYAVPGILAATAVGVALGTISGLKPNSWADSVVRGVSYFGLGVPHFYIAGFLWVYVGLFKYGAPDWVRYTGASGVLAITLLAAQTRYTRAEIREFAGTDFIKLVKAKGAGPGRVARHLLRNAALPLLTLFVAELLSVLVLTGIVVEKAFRIDGIGSLAFSAMDDRNMPLIVGVVLVVSVIGILGTFLQDVLYTVLDPRIGFDE